jgi:hypothetical protein
MTESPPRPFDPTRLWDRTPVSEPGRFPAGRNPYYIVTPRLVLTSAGIKALHLLCHSLNRVGQEAYVVIDPGWSAPDAIHPDLLTPILSQDAIRRHRVRDVSPIVLYPETIAGNPVGGRTVVRYVLNYPGLLGGDHAYPPNELVFGYSAALAASVEAGDQVLFIPASDPTIFSPGKPRERDGSCFWAMKYQVVHKGELLPVTEGAVEITRDLPDSPHPLEIAELFRRSELFYAYENTALALEAALCLCPTVFLPNTWLTEVIAVKEMGWDGFAWGTDPAEIERAKATVHLARDRYLAAYTQFWDQLSAFVEITQARAAKDAAVWGFPPRIAGRIAWRRGVELAGELGRAAAGVWRREGPVEVLRRARPWIARFGRALSRQLTSRI